MEIAGAFPSRRHFCERPLRVKLGPSKASAVRLLYPEEQTLPVPIASSVSCQFQTHAAQQVGDERSARQPASASSTLLTRGRWAGCLRSWIASSGSKSAFRPPMHQRTNALPQTAPSTVCDAPPFKARRRSWAAPLEHHSGARTPG